ncbi:MAG: glycosyl hydrolase family 65 protein [bacterium]
MNAKRKGKKLDIWRLTYTDWRPKEQPLREALCTLGNGYFATRGAAEEVVAGGNHYPGTYVAGGYNRLKSEVSGHVIENEDLVNWPNWLGLSFSVDDGEWYDIDSVEVVDFEQALDMRHGVLERRVRFYHHKKRLTTLESRRIVHMHDPNLAAIEWTLTPENWSGRIEICSSLDGAVTNSGVARYRQLNGQHLELVDLGEKGEDGIYLKVQTTQSRIQMGQSARTRVFGDGSDAAAERRTQTAGARVKHFITSDARRGVPLRVEKVVSIHTCRDFAMSEPLTASCLSIERAGGFEDLLESHTRAWSQLWSRADIEIGKERSREQMLLHLHIFHLLQVASPNTIYRDAGVPARGLHGEAYRGHIFWDELFIFPFLNLRMPELTRELLMYRCRRLSEARHLAAEEGYAGAMYPWQSGSTGREESQVLHLNPKSGRWVKDNTHRQRHVNAAIAYNLWQYIEATNDIEFLSFYGAEVLLEIARFWASIAQLNPERGRYEIHNVVGPDEFHTSYPGAEDGGLNNNSYTNFMAVWVLCIARRALGLLADERAAELKEDLRLDDDELARWEDIEKKMYIPFHGDGIISQFEGYEDLDEFEWEKYKKKFGDIQRLDRILEAEDDSPNNYKASKQADVVMLFCLFSAEELAAIFEHLGYELKPDTIPKNIEYYMKRTSHGSTLSRIIHSWVLARSEREQAWNLFQTALKSDFSDIQGGTTQEGVHLGAMAGTVDLIQRAHTGIEMRDGVLWLNPCLPEELSELRLRVRYRGHWLRLAVTHEQVEVVFEHGWSAPASVGFKGRVYKFEPGDRKVLKLSGTG